MHYNDHGSLPLVLCQYEVDCRYPNLLCECSLPTGRCFVRNREPVGSGLFSYRKQCEPIPMPLYLYIHVFLRSSHMFIVLGYLKSTWTTTTNFLLEFCTCDHILR